MFPTLFDIEFNFFIQLKKNYFLLFSSLYHKNVFSVFFLTIIHFIHFLTIFQWPYTSNDKSNCCINQSFVERSNLDWTNFLGFPKGVDCLMRCMKERKSIFDKEGEAAALNVFTNIQFVDIIPEKQQIFRRCVLKGSGVHTCKEIIYLYICFFRNMKRGEPREWLYK